MLKWLRERNGTQNDEEDPSLASTAPCLSPRSAVSLEALPSQTDRLLMLRAVLFAADTLQSNKFGNEERLKVVLQQELTKNACIALHLVSETEDDDQLYCMTLANAASLDPTTLEMEQPYACITLLVSNVVLLYGSKGGYDARIRHSLKTACVHVLYTHTEASLNDAQNKVMAEFDESVGGIYIVDTGDDDGESAKEDERLWTRAKRKKQTEKRMIQQ